MTDIDIICRFQISLSFYEEHVSWLNEKEGRRLFFIEEATRNEDWTFLQKDDRVKVFILESPLQEEGIAKKIGQLATLKNLLVLDEKWKSLIEPFHRLANLIISDGADFGVKVFSHLQKNLRKPALSFLSLQNAMEKIPAIIVGAGPSLEKENLANWKNHALIFAAGTAINVLDGEPDLAIAIDPHTPLLRRRFFSAPLCFQGRVHPDSLKDVKGAKFYLPDSHFLFEPWLSGQEIFSSGWTVGNTAVAMAAHLGCDPIILVGMDFCYRNQQKYGGQKEKSEVSHLVRARNEKGEVVWTQNDWLLAVRWMEEFALQDQGRQWINATEGGLDLGRLFLRCRLDSIAKTTSGVCAKWDEAIKKATPIAIDPAKWSEWRASLTRCREKSEGEIANDLLLEPLWNIWKPLFERELMTDKVPIPLEEKWQANRDLFFNQIIEEHLKIAKRS